jgi:hypothetical protein
VVHVFGGLAKDTDAGVLAVASVTEECEDFVGKDPRHPGIHYKRVHIAL